MSRKYEPEFKRKIVRLHLEEGRSYKSITAEYGVSKTAVSHWCEEFSKECQSISQNNPTAFTEAVVVKLFCNTYGLIFRYSSPCLKWCLISIV